MNLEEQIVLFKQLAQENAKVTQEHAKMLNEIVAAVNSEKERLTTLALSCAELTKSIRTAVQMNIRYAEAMNIMISEHADLRSKIERADRAEIIRDLNTKFKELTDAPGSHLRIV